MLSGMARRAAKSGLAVGQEDLGSSGSREETEMEQREAGVDSRGARGAGRHTNGPRKSGLVGRGDAEGGKTVECEREAVELEGDKAVATSAHRDQENEQDDMETGTVPQLDGADNEGKRDKKESDKSLSGVKRGRGSMSGAPPSKVMQLSSGERVATSAGEKEIEGEEEEEEEGEEETGKKDKTSKQKQEFRKSSTHRVRTRSLSNSDSPLAVGVASTKTSPMTRSHSAVKKDVEFVSLPSTKKRKKGGSGRWPKRDTPSPSPSQESSKAETPTKQPKTDTPGKSGETATGKQKADPDSMTEKEEESSVQEEGEDTPTQPIQPPKRRRGRPPKHQRKDSLTPTAPLPQPPKGKATGGGSGSGGGGGGGGGRGRGKGRSISGESSGSDKKGAGRGAKGEGDSSKDSESKGETKSGKSGGTKEEETMEENSPAEAEIPLSDSRGEDDSTAVPSGGTTERRKKKKERRASCEDGKLKATEKASKKKTTAISEEEVATKKEMGDNVSDAVESATPEQNPGSISAIPGQVGTSRASVFVSVLSGPGKPVGGGGGGGEEVGRKEKEEEEVEVVSQDVVQSHDPGEEGAPQKPSHVVPNNYSPTMPYPATTIPPFPPHAAYPYPPGPYPPPLMFPGSSNPMYPHYYPGYPPPLPPPPPASMPGAFIPSCPSDPHPSFSTSQPLTTVCGVQVSVLDKPPSQLSTILSPHSPHSPHNLPITSQPQVPSTHTVAMELARHYPPHPLSQTYRLPGPGGGPYMPPSPYVSVRIDATGMPFVDWGMPHSHLPPHHPKMEDMNKLAPGKLEPKQEEVPVQSVECPECGRSFKNNKALNGHMRLHGGFDWTKKPFNSSQQQSSSSSTTESSSDAAGNKPHPPNEDRSHTKKSGSKKHNNHPRSRSGSPGAESSKRHRHSNGSNDGEKRLGEPSVFTFDTSQMHPSQHAMPPPPSLNTMHDAGTMTAGTEGGVAGGSKGATLDDLCRAVEALEKMENGSNPSARDSDEDDKRRPRNIHIPTHTSPSLDRDRHRFGSTPPYTPPPILSPARSMTMLAAPGTPSRILQPWSCRRTSDHRKPSEAEEGGGYPEPKINVGRQFQAMLPPFDGGTPGATVQDTHSAEQIWKPIPQPLEEDESVMDGFLELACSPAIQHAGRNKEYALHVLHSTGGSVKEAVRLLLSGKSIFPEDHTMSTYHYSGSKQWSAKERQQFRRAWRVHRKQFHLLKSAVEGKALPEITEYYYYWKKYCNDEYRGRNRHISEEIISDEDMADPRSNSSESSSSSEVEPSTALSSNPPPETDTMAEKIQWKAKGEGGAVPRPSATSHFDLPIVYAPHSSRVPRGVPVQQYKCKYPGCTQVFTSIFALNGHIRIHGGSFYPKADKKDGRSSSPSTASSTPPNIHPSHHHHSTLPTVRPSSNGPIKHGRPTASVAAEMRSAQHMEIARALLDLPQPRSPARGAYHTPSPKPTVGSKRSPSGKKKMSSSSPGEHEGYYPCNRCGRVFTKVKSRSAHMKSHIMKPS